MIYVGRSGFAGDSAADGTPEESGEGRPRAAARTERSFLGIYSFGKGIYLFAPLRFLWNATRGHRFAPWRSEYLRWRVETYSGKRAEALTFGEIFQFMWVSRWELLGYLAWIGRLERETQKRV
jgi:hypothetical protein